MPPTNSDKNVYILGAGFSRGLGLPLQEDFLQRAKDVYFSNTSKYKHFESVFNYQAKLSRIRNYLNYPLLNLEHLFNLLEMDIFYSKNEESKQIKNDFVTMIRDVLIETTPTPFKNRNDGKLITCKDIYREIINFIRTFVLEVPSLEIKTTSDTIITFNYDLVIEAAVSIFNYERTDKNDSPFHRPETLHLNVLFGKNNISYKELSSHFKENKPESLYNTNILFHSEDSDDIDSSTAVSNAINFIKLHGSINWAEGKKQDVFLIPPTWNKSDSKIRKLWEKAYNELKEAKRIIFIGYSFPETDIYVKSLLALALNDNQIIQNIYFINPDKGEGKARCMNMLDKHFEGYCEYIDLTFNEFMHDKDLVVKTLNRKIETKGVSARLA